MKFQKVIFLLLVVTVTLIILLSTGVGYAAVREDSIIAYEKMNMYPEHSDFNVKFAGKPTYTGSGKAVLKTTGKTTAKMDVYDLHSAGDYVVAIFKIENTSHDIRAELFESVTNGNNEYFKVTASLSNDTINPKGGKANLYIRVELIKTPISKAVTTNICVRVTAEPIIEK